MGEDAQKIADGLSENEKWRLIAGRLDWREDSWQDHCGDLECKHCEGALIPDAAPHRLPDHDKAIRAIIMERMGA